MAERSSSIDLSTQVEQLTLRVAGPTRAQVDRYLEAKAFVLDADIARRGGWVDCTEDDVAAIGRACERRAVVVQAFELRWIYQNQRWVPRQWPASGVTATRTSSTVTASDTGASPRSQSGPQVSRQQPAIQESGDKAVRTSSTGPKTDTTSSPGRQSSLQPRRQQSGQVGQRVAQPTTARGLLDSKWAK
ncbi:Nn.00g026800.m01.CDS01 [Neocucurbitaria sp. VM-36]